MYAQYCVILLLPLLNHFIVKTVEVLPWSCYAYALLFTGQGFKNMEDIHENTSMYFPHL